MGEEVGVRLEAGELRWWDGGCKEAAGAADVAMVRSVDGTQISFELGLASLRKKRALAGRTISYQRRWWDTA